MQLQRDVCEVFQKLLSSNFILGIWKSFRESGNLSEGKVTSNAFMNEISRQLKKYVSHREFSFLSTQFFNVLAPDEYEDFVEQLRAELMDILRRAAEQPKDINPAFDTWFKSTFEHPFEKWFRQNFDCQFDKMLRTTFETLCDRYLRHKITSIFDVKFDEWLGPKFRCLYERLFERFSLESEDDKIDVQDLVISLAVLALMELEQQLEMVFQLTDVDEDGCLSIQDIMQMIQRIERLFNKETAFITSESYVLHHELAFRRAARKFSWATLKLNKQLDLKNDELGLIERKDFLNCLKLDRNLYEAFLPKHLEMYDVLLTEQNEREYVVNDRHADLLRQQDDSNQGLDFRRRELSKKDNKIRIEADEQEKQEIVTFDIFRKEIRACLRQKDKQWGEYLNEQSQKVRYPAQVEGKRVKKVMKLEQFEAKVDQRKQVDNINQKQNSKSNQIETHQVRLRQMEEQRKGWTLNFNENKK